MPAQKRKAKHSMFQNRDITVECFECRKAFYAAIPILSRICPTCQLGKAQRPERSKYSVTEVFEGRRVYIVKRFMEVEGNPYWQHCGESCDIEEVRSAIPEGARRYSKSLLDSPDVVETWIC